jgi:enolase
MSRIRKLLAREVLNSRGQWTLGVHVESERGLFANAYFPLGRSRSPYEPAIPDLRETCEFIRSDLAPQLVKENVEDQFVIDAIIEHNCKQRPFLGKTLLPVSVAVLKLAAIEQNTPLWKYMRQRMFVNDAPKSSLPLPFVTLFMGGLLKYPFLDKPVPAENFQVVQLILEAQSVTEAIRLANNIYRRLSLRLSSESAYKGIGQDGGIAYFGRVEDMLELALEETSRLTEAQAHSCSFGFAIDAAAEHLRVGNGYQLV